MLAHLVSMPDTGTLADLFTQRLKELEQAEAQALANLNAIIGSKQECQYWLSRMKGGNDAKVQSSTRH